MAQWVQVCVAKLDNMCSIPGTYTVDRTDSSKLSWLLTHVQYILKTYGEIQIMKFFLSLQEQDLNWVPRSTHCPDGNEVAQSRRWLNSTTWLAPIHPALRDQAAHQGEATQRQLQLHSQVLGCDTEGWTLPGKTVSWLISPLWVWRSLQSYRIWVQC